MDINQTQPFQVAPATEKKINHSALGIEFRQVTPLIASLPASSSFSRSPLNTINENGPPNGPQRSTARLEFSLRLHRGFCTRLLNDFQPAMRSDAHLTEANMNDFNAMFSPGFSDVVNDTVRMTSAPSMLTKEYRSSDDSRNRILSQVIRDIGGVDVASIQRTLTHTNYLRVDFKDILMFHPSAWGFPEADLNKTIIGTKRASDTVHGWLWQEAVDADAEMADVSFSRTTVIRRIPESTFHAFASGKSPAWLSGISSITADTGAIERLASTMGLKWDLSRILESGLLEPSQVHVNLAEIRNARLLEPESLNHDLKLRYEVKGLDGLRMCLSNRADSRTNITPSQVVIQAFQLGVYGDFHYFWICLFILKFPLPQGWTMLIKDGMRMYLNHATHQQQHVHPYQPQFLGIAHSLHMAQALWDSRGAVNIACDDCSAPQSVLFCLQCTGFMCLLCFLKIHSSRMRHDAYTYAGCRYLSEKEVELISPYLHLTNIGFCNRRRFLARSNQSDKTGTCQCEWLHFDSIEALNDIPCEFSDSTERRLVRAVEEGKGFYYNFANGTATEDPHEFISESKKVLAMTLVLQAWFRGTVCRKRLAVAKSAAIRIQKNMRMMIVRRRYKYFSRGSPLFHWFERFGMMSQRNRMIAGICRFQALVRQVQTRERFLIMRRSAIRIQSFWRASHLRDALMRSRVAALRIQCSWRGYHYGYKQVLYMHAAAAKLQAVARGVRSRDLRRVQTGAAIHIQAFIRGILARTRNEERFHGAVRIQSCWRRFYTTIQFKFDAVEILSGLIRDFEDTARLRAMGSASVQIQRHVRGHQQRKRYIQLGKQVKKFEQPVAKALAQILTSITGIHSPVHYWFRYLPEAIQDRLRALKNIVQYGTCRCGPELAAWIIKTVIKALVHSSSDSSLVLQYVAHSVSHTFAGMKGSESHSVLRTAAVGTGLVPARPGEPLISFPVAIARPLMIRSERSLYVEESAFAFDALRNSKNKRMSLIRGLCLNSLVLIPFREFLAQPRLLLESRLAFQGVDVEMAYQVFDIIGYEMGVDLPIPDLVQKPTCGESATLLNEWMRHNKPLGTTTHNVTLAHRDFRFFARERMWEIFQGLGPLIRSGDQDAQNYARHVQEVQSILKEAQMAFAQEHYEFAAGVVILHFTIRALIIKELWDRAASVIQTHFRYYITRGRVRRYTKPAITIQRFWRGLAVALRLVRLDRAAAIIQENYRIIRARRMNRKLLNAVSLIQAVWRGSIQRKHLSCMWTNAIVIQSRFRAHLVRLYIGSSEGRVLRGGFLQKLIDAGQSVEQRENIILSYRAELENHKRRMLQSKHVRARQIQRKVDQYRKALQSVSKQHAIPTSRRSSPFEPPCFASRRARDRSTVHAHVGSELNEIVLGAGSIIQSLKMSFS